MKAGIKNEDFWDVLEESEKAVYEAMEYLERVSKGNVICVKLERREPPLPDDGDILTFRYNGNGEKYWFRTIDVKQNANWSGAKFPYDTIFLAKKHNLHHDWVYIVFNNERTHIAIVDMNKVHMNSIECTETKTRTGTDQLSAAVPLSHAVIKEI